MDSEILILGSFPSVISRETNFYYGNKQNRFWKILAEAFGEPAPETISDKQALLTLHKIALWDVVAECEITGSLDSTIKNYKVADLRQVLDKANVKKIILNGGKAKEIFVKNYPHLVDIAVFLPSTSPLNTRFDKTIWLNALKNEKD